MNANTAQLVALGAAKLVVTSSVSKVITNAVKTYVPAKNQFEQIQILIGGAAIGGLVADAASNKVEDKAASMIGFVEAVKKSVAEKKAQQEAENAPEESE